MIISYVRGHAVYWDGVTWRYKDNNKSIENEKRACKRCGRYPTKEGHDFCIGKLDNVVSACCGHGVSTPIKINKEGDRK